MLASASLPMPALIGGGAAALIVLAVVVRLVLKARVRKLEATLAAEVAAGKYFRALSYYLDRGRFAEAAAIEAAKGNKDKAGRLYERAGDLEKAGEMYLASGDFGMAALFFRDAGMKAQAADAFARDGRHDTSAELYEELGDHEQAAEQWRLKGDLERAATALEKAGKGEVAYRVHAEAAEQAGNWLEAARQWERAGELDRALGIYKKLNEFGELARLYEARGELAEAAALRMRASDFEEAGRLYQAADKPKEAAHAFWRSGDLARAVSLLEGLGDWLTMAKVFLSYEKHEEARKVLRQLTPSHAGYRPGLQLLASLEERERRPEDAYRVYEKLVRYAVETKTVDANTRTWIIAMARILFRKDKREEGLATYKKLHPLGLMTAEDAEYVTRLEAVQERKRHSTGQFRALSQVLGAPSNERYEFRTMIAQGGNGVIWLAHDNTLDREMVIKMIRQTALPSDIAIQWFLREAKTAAKLNHPNIVTIYDLGEMQGQPYIAMEYVAGETLVDLVERTELPMQPKSLVTICEPLCSALNYAHDKGFVHRDIKLENVMITSTGEVKLMDFGLAQAMHGPDDDDMVTGTPLYMAPEQIVGGEVDHRADIYALGVMVYLLAAGQWPFERGNILHHHRFTPVPDPREFNPDLPEAFSDVIMKCLAKNRDERYGKVTEVAEDLRRSLLG